MAMARISWNTELEAVVVDSVTAGCFAVSSLPTMLGTLDDAVAFANRNRGWRLPSPERAVAIRKHLRKINTVLKTNGMPVISRRTLLWTDEYWYFDPMRLFTGVLCLYMSSGKMYEFDARERHEFRLIMELGHGTQE